MNQEKDRPREGVLPNLSLLYIEDDPETRIELTRFLKRRLGKVSTAENGIEGLKKLERESIDLIITDLKMPLMDGMKMVEEIREKGLEIPVIITSALSDSEGILEAMDLGVVKYVVKPMDPEALMEVIGTIGEKLWEERRRKQLKGPVWSIKEEKVALEKQLEKKTAAILKKWTGKGPRKIQVFIQGEEIFVNIQDMLTPMEKKLSANPKHITLISYFRRSLYEELKKELEEHFAGVLSLPCQLTKVEQDIREDREYLVFTVE
ncbi:Na-translocating system protein MpsC family protein [Isachenkonia alkalipeptolytica]|uniref:Stage 0 sporulation protein A homolog n=1 Tax=Isachenkonia alkalipeptolytica TaxID=2565777 RepID=A0AA44BFM5_9CLOT|nr:Na-translocating system protein MpsC family protein [Isachenkonia alkalipeptolytica]NBG88631.1 response regulator [Isachenkonia alkalipeptolytica]